MSIVRVTNSQGKIQYSSPFQNGWYIQIDKPSGCVSVHLFHEMDESVVLDALSEGQMEEVMFPRSLLIRYCGTMWYLTRCGKFLQTFTSSVCLTSIEIDWGHLAVTSECIISPLIKMFEPLRPNQLKEFICYGCHYSQCNTIKKYKIPVLLGLVAKQGALKVFTFTTRWECFNGENVVTRSRNLPGSTMLYHRLTVMFIKIAISLPLLEIFHLNITPMSLVNQSWDWYLRNVSSRYLKIMKLPENMLSVEDANFFISFLPSSNLAEVQLWLSIAEEGVSRLLECIQYSNMITCITFRIKLVSKHTNCLQQWINNISDTLSARQGSNGVSYFTKMDIHFQPRLEFPSGRVAERLYRKLSHAASSGFWNNKMIMVNDSTQDCCTRSFDTLSQIDWQLSVVELDGMPFILRCQDQIFSAVGEAQRHLVKKYEKKGKDTPLCSIIKTIKRLQNWFQTNNASMHPPPHFDFDAINLIFVFLGWNVNLLPTNIK